MDLLVLNRQSNREWPMGRMGPKGVETMGRPLSNEMDVESALDVLL